jgi:hypothetical protein
METFLAVEGVNVVEKSASASYRRYVEKRNKRMKINKGEALIDFVQVVHQRVIDRRKAGFAVGPNQAPHLGAEDWQAQISAFDRAHGLPVVVPFTGNAFEASRKQENAVETNGDDHASVTDEEIQALQVKERCSQSGAALSVFVPDAIVPPPTASDRDKSPTPRLVRSSYYPTAGATTPRPQDYQKPHHVRIEDRSQSCREWRASDRRYR